MIVNVMKIILHGYCTHRCLFPHVLFPVMTFADSPHCLLHNILITHACTQIWPLWTMFILPVDYVFKKQIKHERQVSAHLWISKHSSRTNITLYIPLQKLYLPQRLNRNGGEPLGGQQNWSHVAPFYPFLKERGDFEKAIKPVWRAGTQTQW